jgi:ammonia channel protein AmtB
MDDADGFEAGTSGTQGDPRVLVAMNVVLSTVFAATVVWGLSYLGAAEFTLVNVATGAVLLVAVSYVVSTR